MKHKFLFLTATVLLATVFLSACSSTDDQTSSTPAQSVPGAVSTSVAGTSDSAAADRVFTTEELATYNGKDGQPAYVAVNGVVYDVTDVPEWANGEHANGQLTAGQDLTEEITNESPHGLSVLDDLPVVGTLE